MPPEAPKVFISYSWSSPEYSQRVMALAEHLRRDGVNTILDRWHLSEGQDAFAFMERAVTDPSFVKVLILCDPSYADKANDRAGGVGTETLIISPNVYREAKQTKFVPVIMERRSDNSVPLPAYLDGRIYVDLSNPEKESEEYERLLRAIFGKPDVTPPPVGNPPEFLDDSREALLTGRSLAQYKEAVLRDRIQQHGYLDSYLSRLVQAFEAERIESAASAEDLLGKVQASLDHFRPYRDEFIGFIDFIGRFSPNLELFDRLHRFFEEVTAARLVRSPMPWDQEAATENLSFLIRELAVYMTAGLLARERFEGLGKVLSPVYAKLYMEGSGRMRGVEVLDPPLRQLARDDRYRDPIAQLFESRRHDSLSQQRWLDTELFLAIRSRLDRPPAGVHFGASSLWWPAGLGWDWDPTRSELAVRMKDPSYRSRLFPSLGVASIQDLIDRVNAVENLGEERPVFRILSKASLSALFGLTDR